jgi:WD40 repeat protein
VWSVVWSPGGLIAASTAAGGTVDVWDAATRQEVRAIPFGQGTGRIALGPDGRTLVVTCPDGIIRLVDVRTGREIRTLEGHDKRQLGIAFSPDGTVLATGGWDRMVKLWDVVGGEEILTINSGPTDVEALDLSPDGRFLAYGTGDRIVLLDFHEFDDQIERWLGTNAGPDSAQ